MFKELFTAWLVSTLSLVLILVKMPLLSIGVSFIAIYLYIKILLKKEIK